MRRLTALLAAMTLIILALSGPADALTGSCAPQTAWAGSETTYQGGATLVQIPVAVAMTLIRVQVSSGFAQRDTVAPGFSEQLTLVGFSHGPVVMDGVWPTMPPSGDFGTNVVTTTDGSTHNENAHLSGSVIGSSIVKSRTGYGNDQIDASVSIPLAPGDVIWVNYDTLSTPHVSLDPEVQIDVTYTPAVCS